LAAALGWLFFRPVRSAIERRRSALEGEQRAAAEARAAAEQEVRAAQAKRAALETSLAEMRERILREAETERERLVEAARVQMQHERETLEAELTSQRRAQARSVASDAAFAAREIVVRLLAAMQGPDLEHTLRRAACRELETLRSEGPLAPVVVESMQTLEADALADLACATGVRPDDLSQRVESELVAGVRVLTARGLVDASAAGLAAQAERELVLRLERESGRDG